MVYYKQVMTVYVVPILPISYNLSRTEVNAPRTQCRP
jgi:hypothetical protein